MSVEQLYRAWADSVQEPDLKQELAEIAGDEAQIRARFYQPLKFGTAGLRAEVGAGSARMNVYTVARATQGVAQYLKRSDYADAGAVVYRAAFGV